MIFIKELIRFTTQHQQRTLYCYLILSIWIFLLIAGMYKYINSTENMVNFLNSKSIYSNKLSELDEETLKMQNHLQNFCNPVQNIVQKEEGGLIEGWSLQGVLLLIRHGTRGSLMHVKGINTIDCSHDSNDVLLNKYKSFLLNSTTTSGPNNNGHASWTKQGPFHGFPLLPSNPKSCLLGQLTYKGISQLLHIGEILKFAYSHSLDLYRKPLPIVAPKNINNLTENVLRTQFLNSDDIVIYSTRYRRTFQSAMALLYTFLPLDRWQNLQLKESHSLSFCFSDCACQNAEYLSKILSKQRSNAINRNPTISLLVQWIGSKLLLGSDTQQSPLDVRDALLTYLCHGIEFPCPKAPGHSEKKSKALHTTPHPEQDNLDVINIDQDDISINLNSFPKTLQEENTSESEEEEDEDASLNDVNDGCVEFNHVDALLSFTSKYALRESKNKNMQHQRLLRAYGLIRNIVNFMLKMISGDKVKFVLYSCHDKTLEYIISALGLILDPAFIPYAARLSFEVYRSEKDTQYYFRLVYNGLDVTKSISFCEGSKSLRVKRGRVGHADLCPIENIIRFFHDDYFLDLNATNFKDACAKEPQKDSYF